MSNEAFEAWAASEGMNLARRSDRPEQYANATVQGRWVTWQAATERAAKLAEDTDVVEARDSQYAQLGDAAATREAIAAAIRAAGGAKA